MVKLYFFHSTTVQLTCCYHQDAQLFGQVTQFFTHVLVFHKQVVRADFCTHWHEQVQVINHHKVYFFACLNLILFQECTDIIDVALCWQCLDLIATRFLAHHFDFKSCCVDILADILGAGAGQHGISTQAG